ncbi:MAG: guanylate kinase [Bacteroidaceae bacterium]|nr:guanylate kinase [Bacteroidaceae bacterium]
MSKLIVFCAPSGSGKSTLIAHTMERLSQLSFSISATSRPPRGQERDGVEYYFLSADEMRRRIDRGEFIEWCEVYPGRYYGTLRAEVDRLLDAGRDVVLDLDVEGAANIKKIYGDRALTVFIQPPSIEELRRRLTARATDAPEVIETRIARARYELSLAPQFDHRIVNDDLRLAQDEVVETVSSFLQTP